MIFLFIITLYSPLDDQRRTTWRKAATPPARSPALKTPRSHGDGSVDVGLGSKPAERIQEAEEGGRGIDNAGELATGFICLVSAVQNSSKSTLPLPSGSASFIMAPICAAVILILSCLRMLVISSVLMHPDWMSGRGRSIEVSTGRTCVCENTSSTCTSE